MIEPMYSGNAFWSGIMSNDYLAKELFQWNTIKIILCWTKHKMQQSKQQSSISNSVEYDIFY